MSIVVRIDNITAGSGSISLVDESADGTSENIVTRSITGSVTIDNTGCGSVTGSYQDYVTYGSGGSRSAQLQVLFLLDSVSVGSAIYTYTDNYGAVITPPPPPPPVEEKPFPWWILLLLLLLAVLTARRKRGK